MIKIKLKNGKVVEVTKNVAHGLIEKGKAVLYKRVKKYPNKMMGSKNVRNKQWI
jgi:hypothetical protein